MLEPNMASNGENADEMQVESVGTAQDPPDSTSSDSNIDPSLQAGGAAGQPPTPSNEAQESPAEDRHLGHTQLATDQHDLNVPPPHPPFPFSHQLPLGHQPPPLYLYSHPPPDGMVHPPHHYYGPIPIHYDEQALRVAAAINSVNGHMNSDSTQLTSNDLNESASHGPNDPNMDAQQNDAGGSQEGLDDAADSASGKSKIHRVFMACQHCKRRKSKCDGARPECVSCIRMGYRCEYAAERRMRGPNKNKRPPGEAREARFAKKSRVQITAEQDAEDRAGAEFANQPQQHLPFMLPEQFQGMVPLPPHYDLIHHDPHNPGAPPPPHLLDPATYQVQATAAVHAQLLLNAQAVAAAAVAANPHVSMYGAPPPSSPSRVNSAVIRHATISQTNTPFPLPSNRVPSQPYQLPTTLLSVPAVFPTREAFQDIVSNYLGSLSRKAADKALLPQLTYTAILALLLDQDIPQESLDAEPSVSTPLFKFWVRKSFHLGKLDGEDVVMHNGKPVAVREQLHDILVCCHAATKHGGRDKTCAMINEHYSWVPKAFVESFVKSCPGCPRRKKYESFPGTVDGIPEDAGIPDLASSSRTMANAIQSDDRDEQLEIEDNSLEHQPMALVDGPILDDTGSHSPINETNLDDADREAKHPKSTEQMLIEDPTVSADIKPITTSVASLSGMSGTRMSKKRTAGQGKQPGGSGKKPKAGKASNSVFKSDPDDKIAENALMELAAGSVAQ